MKGRLAFLFAISILAAPAASGKTFDEFLTERLQQNVAYRQAVLQQRVAQQSLDSMTRFYLPYVSVGIAPSGSSSGIIDSLGGLNPVTLSPSVVFSDVLGADFSVSLPLSLDPAPDAGSGVVTLGDPTLSISRKLFEETDVTRLGARAALIRARNAASSAYSDVRIGLVTDVFNAYVAARTLEDAQRRLDIAQNAKDASKDEDQSDVLERAVLMAQRSLIQAQRALRGIEPGIVGQADALYAEIDRRFDGWIAALPATGTIPSTSTALAAEELDLAAAEAMSSRSFLPYVPNPTFSALVGYDTGGGGLFWRISFNLSIPILDRGERALNAFQRKETAEIERLRLSSARASLTSAVQNAWEELALREITLKISKIDLANQQESTDRIRQLYDGGFVSKSYLTDSELALSAAELQVAGASNGYRLQQLSLVRYFSEDGDT